MIRRTKTALALWLILAALAASLAGCISFNTFNLTVNDYRTTSQPEGKP